MSIKYSPIHTSIIHHVPAHVHQTYTCVLWYFNREYAAGLPPVTLPYKLHNMVPDEYPQEDTDFLFYVHIPKTVPATFVSPMPQT